MPADSCLSQDPSEANTHTRVFLYERVAMVLFTLDTAFIQEHLL